MAWFTSWLPSLPAMNITIPAAIQRRFLSFILKRCLGHFLKPGQLDHYQIDSQIGSGYVQVNQLELDPQAINSYIDGFPVSMKEGSVAAVRAHIPWPNPLASTVGISLTSAHFIFEVTPSRDRTPNPNVDLADSVASVANSFIHQELSPTEEQTLWQSFHGPHSSPSVYQQEPSIPGTLGVSTSFEDPSAKFDYDPAGVSVFASLIENLLARFEFDARDIKISLVHADNICITLSLQEAMYQTDAKANTGASPDMVQGEHRTLSFSGFSLSVTQLGAGHRSPSPLTIHPVDDAYLNETEIAHPDSPASSRSSIDEETPDAMSQSLAALPPQPNSPSDSFVSSIYQSALSIASPIVEEQDMEGAPGPIFLSASVHREAAAVLHSQEQTILSLGPRPITIVLTTPSPISANHGDDYSPPEPKQERPLEELHVTITMSTIACTIKPCHLNGLLRLSQALSPSPHNPTPPRQSVNKPRLPPLKVTLTAHGFVLLLDPTGPHDTYASMVDFFEKPLTPPPCNHGYSRIHLETLVISAGITTTPQGETVALKSCIDLTMADISIFSFTPISQESLELKAFPLLITDRYLVSQYPSQHEQPDNAMPHPTLPTFSNSDWTQERFQTSGSKLSLWRTRPPKADALSSGSSFQMRGCHTAMLGGIRKDNSRITDELKIDLSPLHVRVDLDHLVRSGGLLSFFDGLLPIECDVSDKQSVYSDDTVDNSPLLWRKNISDDLESPFRDPISTHPLAAMAEAAQRLGLDRDENTLQLIVVVPLLRISLRCPSPPQYPQRSGILVADIHELCIATGSTPAKRSARFANDEEEHSPRLHEYISGDSVQLNVQFQRAVFASSTVGSISTAAFASIGSLKDNQGEEFEAQRPPLLPCIQLVKPDSNKAATMMALSVTIPAMYADISKPCMDGLQYFTDDVAQFLERSGSIKGIDEVEGGIQDTKLIGSRFFAKSWGGSLSSSVADTAEMVVKMTLTEAFIRVGVPRRDNETISRPFDLKALDVDMLLEINPDGKQQTILTLGLMDFLVLDTVKDGTTQTFLSLTSPHSLTTTPKSIIKLRFSTATLPEVNTRETRVKLTLCGFTYTFFPDLDWVSDLADFGKNPPGTFESVIPSDRTRVSIKLVDGSVRMFAPNHPGSLVTHVQELEFATDVVGDSCDSSFRINATSVSLLALDDCIRQEPFTDSKRTSRGVTAWTASGYALFIEVPDLDMLVINHLNGPPEWKIDVHRISLRLHMCADTLTAVGSIISDLGKLSQSSEESTEITKPEPPVVRPSSSVDANLMSSVDDLTFKRMPEVGAAPDMINDDLPTNMYYLDGSFGPAAGLREIRDDDLDEFDTEDITAPESSDPSIISRVGGETIKILDAQGLESVDDYFLDIPTEANSRPSDLSDSKICLRIFDGNFDVFLYDGYDWARTRKAIEEGVKEMRKRLAKIRQLVANGHVEESSLDDTSALLFNSIHIGLDDDDGALGEPAALIAAIDRELKEDEVETASWQSLPTFSAGKQPKVTPTRVHGRRLIRSRGPSIEFSFQGLRAEYDKFYHDSPLVSRTFVTVRDAEILDHIKTSTWKKFLTQLRSDSKGNVRETDSNMVRVELRSVRPVPGDLTEEERMKAKILPLRLYVDQDAVDFLKKFFSFNDPSASSADSSTSQEAYIQHAEVFPIDLKLDYKPRRVDYRALKQGRTIELMNFFHFDGAEMTLRHITLSGITGWGRLFELLNDLWTPDVKATQLAEVISGVSPIRSVVNVGSGVADLILLPISQYKKDGRIVRGVQKGAKAFVKSTAIEAVKMGAKLATGTQVILEQAEGILGGNFEAPITAETVQISPGDDFVFDSDEVDEESADLRSKYAQQPADIKEGVQFAYKSLRKNLSSAAQTILAVPMEVYERSGNEGPIRSVIRAVPIAVLKPMIGASEAVSKTLQGLHNTLDPNVRHENEAKYKR